MNYATAAQGAKPRFGIGMSVPITMKNANLKISSEA